MAMQMVQRRNIVVLGKTGAGKSTVANKISGYENFEVKKSTKSVTSQVSHTEVTVTDPNTNVIYNFKLIDTVGVFDTSVRPNNEVMNEIKEYFQDKLSEGVNLVLFVFRQGRFTKEERDTFDYIIANFREHISAISALVITNCDGLDQDGRQGVVADFESTAESTAQFMKKGIYAVGFPDTRQMKATLRKAYKEDMEDDATILRKLTMEAGEMRLGKEMFSLSFWQKLHQCVIL